MSTEVITHGNYNFQFFPFMAAGTEQSPESEPYVVCPPALFIRDRQRNTWTMGFMRPHRDPHRRGEYEFDVVRNGRSTGEYACRIEYLKGKIRIYGHEGWRTWSGSRFI